jgi:sugar/nucleoside kinase (ribokinase family)
MVKPSVGSAGAFVRQMRQIYAKERRRSTGKQQGWAPAVKDVCVTLRGSGSLTGCSGREIRTPPFKVDCIDSTGAGDVFRDAFAAGCLAMPRGDLEEVLRFANAAAALNCRALGSRGALPTAGEVERLVGRDSELDGLL